MILCLVLASCGFVVTGVADESQAPAAGSSGRARMHRTTVAALDSRVQLMSKELDLDAIQQSRLKSILLTQRAEVAQVWNDPSVPAPVRIGATQAISEKTADRIRAMLNPEQREKYIRQHQRDTPVGAPGGDVQKWMKPDPG
jgi:Spy/CpxP family protein refolding chaperone